MIETIVQKDWADHPFLSKLIVRSDYDGDASYTIKNPTEEDFKMSLAVNLEYRIQGGNWQLAAFAAKTAFIDDSSMAWYFSPFYHPLFELNSDTKEKQVHEWRAIINSQAV